MTKVTAREVKDFLLKHFAQSFEAVGVTDSDVPDSFDLMLEGVIDSLGVVEMVSAVEEHFGISLQMDGIDPEDLTRIGPFAAYVEANTTRTS
jgi:acyl carrier protein